MRCKDIRAWLAAEAIVAIPESETDAGPDKWRQLFGRRAARAMRYGRNLHNPNRSRCQRKTAQQRLADRKVRPHQKRKANRRLRRQVVAAAA